MSESYVPEEARQFNAADLNIGHSKGEEAKPKSKDLRGVDGMFIAEAINFVTAHPTNKIKLRTRLLEAARSAGISDHKAISFLDLISMPLTGNIYIDTGVLGAQIKDPEIALQLKHGTRPSEILNEVKRGINEWLSEKGTKSDSLVLHSRVMLGIIDKILEDED
jgi:hypothetical protein